MIEFDILVSEGWAIHSELDIDIRVTDEAGAPVDLTNIDLIWRVNRQAGDTYNLYLTIRSDGVSPQITAVAHALDIGLVKSVARCHVDRAAYTAFPGAGVHWHELRDRDSGLVLSKGLVYLLAALPPDTGE